MNQSQFIPAKRKERIEFFKSCTSLAIDVSKLFLATGVLLIFLYCFSEGFVPAGLKLTDAFLFLFVVFSFAVIFGCGVIYGSVAMFWLWKGIAYLGKKYNPTLKVNFPDVLEGKFQSFLSIFICLFALLPIFVIPAKTVYITTLGYFFSIGFFVNFFLFSNLRMDGPLPRRMNYVYMFTIIFCATLLFKPSLINFSLGNIGIRSLPSDIVLLDTKNYEFSSSLAESLGIPFKACEIKKTGKWLTRDLQVDWHGIGDISFVKFTNDISRQIKPSLFPISRVGLSLYRAAESNQICK